MSAFIKRIRRSCKRLSDSEKRMEDIYRIIFDHGDLVMTESATMTRKVRRTYRQCEDDARRVARAISAEIGVTDRFIGLCGENSPKWMVLFWAILKSGNKPYLINLRQPRAFSAGILHTLDAHCVICCDALEDYGVPSFLYDDLLARGGELFDPAAEPAFGNEFAISTSGTTLQEKTCFYSGREISEQLLNVLDICKKNKQIVRPRGKQVKMLVFLPLYHIFGLEAMYLWYAFFGSAFVFSTDLSPESLLRTVRNHEVTHVFAVPLLWHAMEKSVLRRLDSMDEQAKAKFRKGMELSLRLQNISPVLGGRIAKRLFSEIRARLLGDSVLFCISGGSYIKESTLSMINALGYPLSNGYGMTEIGITSVELSKRPKGRIGASVGEPFSSVSYHVDESGQLLVSGRSLCGRMRIDGKEMRLEGHFATGDLVHRDPRGHYCMDGRVSDIVFGDDGENLNPDFAEKAFVLSHALQLSVLGDAENQRLILVVRIPRDLLGVQKETLQAEIEACNATLPASYRVRGVRYTYDALMDEKAIKVSRYSFRKAIADGLVPFVSPDDEETQAVDCVEDSEIKRILRTLFARVLRIPEEEITDTGHFMNDLGGTSLDYFTLVGEINERFGVSLSFEEENFHYTLNDFESIIKDLVA